MWLLCTCHHVCLIDFGLAKLQVLVVHQASALQHDLCMLLECMGRLLPSHTKAMLCWQADSDKHYHAFFLWLKHMFWHDEPGFFDALLCAVCEHITTSEPEGCVVVPAGYMVPDWLVCHVKAVQVRQRLGFRVRGGWPSYLMSTEVERHGLT